MKRAERLKVDPVYAEAYRAKARERSRRRLADPVVYAEQLKKNRERAALKRGPKREVPTEIACTRCKTVYPATAEYFSPRKEGVLKLASQCKHCTAAKARESRIDPEKARRHRAAVAESIKKRFHTDPVFRAASIAKWNAWKIERRKDPEHRQAELAKERAWRKENWERVRKYKHKTGPLAVSHAMRRHAAQLRATPKWANKEKINEIYAECARITMETGIEHHVDHIVPLQGKNVRGLHVHWNLRIIPAELNKRKSNKLIHDLAISQPVAD